ncbi:MAG: hypothetical protein RL220_628 [Bacteroidota bacterium]
MNDAHIHLLVNHVPTIGQVIGFAVFLAGLFLKNETVKRTGAAIILFAAAAVFAASMSGERAEEMVEGMAGMNGNLIHDHEEAGEAAVTGGIVSAALALLYLLAAWKRPGFTRIISWLMIPAIAVSIFLLAQASTKGGLIRHPEIGSGVQSVQSNGGEQGEDND